MKKICVVLVVLLAFVSCTNTLSDVGIDSLSPPRRLIGEYKFTESTDPNMYSPQDGVVFAITADDYQKVVDGAVWSSLKEKIEAGEVELLAQSRSAARWVLYFPEEELIFEATTDGMAIYDTFRGRTITSYYKRLYDSSE